MRGKARYPLSSFLFDLVVRQEKEIVLPVVRVPGRERRLLETMQVAIGEFITDSSQGLPSSPRV